MYVEMKKLTPTAGTKTIKIIPREYAGNLSLVIVDRSKNTTTNVSTTAVTPDGNFIEIEWDVDSADNYLVEGRQYDLVVKDDKGIIYRDSIFVTSQAINQLDDATYDINKDVYVTHTTGGNDFVILED